ncbi:permease [Candidatus Bathyarchaeota archaeon]|nr:permease [Candidatus Bathyarchaeota archaeon]MBT6604631.1 permease [Candidatus Bathyarchaeota archaeon]MBT7187320.1 permease [Candidatus Bathyarchaeota archaeon]MBT7912458.1 permease [Candidatus Bathyarchaeota archaeon]
MAEIIPLFLGSTFLIGLSMEYLSEESLQNSLGGKKGILGMISAAVFGFITPFCSCSSIPVLAGMVAAGLPIGILTTFLIASPYPIEVALLILAPMFGYKFGLAFALAGTIIALMAGYFVHTQKWDDQVREEATLFAIPTGPVEASCGCDDAEEVLADSFIVKTKRAAIYSFDFLKKLFLFVVLGAGIGAVIHGYLPETLLATYLGGSSIYAVPLAALIGVPLYVGIVPMIPIVLSLSTKGVSMGALIAFLITAAALSPPEIIMLSGMFKHKYIGFFVGMVIVGAIVTGYLFNILI